jgi:hypothetical protein
VETFQQQLLHSIDARLAEVRDEIAKLAAARAALVGNHDPRVPQRQDSNGEAARADVNVFRTSTRLRGRMPRRWPSPVIPGATRRLMTIMVDADPVQPAA